MLSSSCHTTRAFHALAFALAFALVGGAGGCHPASAPIAGGGTAGGSPRPSASTQREASCAPLVAPSGDIHADILALGEACGRARAFGAVAPPYAQTLDAADGWQAQFALTLTGGGCYRLLTTTESTLAGFAAKIVDANGVEIPTAPLGESSNGGGATAQFCVPRTTEAQLRARATKGAGRYAMWLWKQL